MQETNDRTDRAGVNEVNEFAAVVEDGINPRDGLPLATIDEVLDAAIAYNTARPNERFLGYIDGAFKFQSPRADGRRRSCSTTTCSHGSLTSLGAAGAAWHVAGRILRPPRDVADTARSIAETGLSRRIPLDERGDELGDLVRTVNAMIVRVETGVGAQRRFVDDAGGELRTPITIVRGHLEMLDARRARSTSPLPSSSSTTSSTA